jgi:hypothetical protein
MQSKWMCIERKYENDISAGDVVTGVRSEIVLGNVAVPQKRYIYFVEPALRQSPGTNRTQAF